MPSACLGVCGMSTLGIHLVCAVAKQEKAPRRRLRLSPFYVDLVSDSRSNPVVHHWLVHREGSPEILFWGQETTLEAAKTAARSHIRDLAQREQQARAA